MNQICKNCKHWTQPGQWDYNDVAKPDFGVCELAHGDDGVNFVANARFYARDMERYSAELLTHSDFGCNQWALTDKSNASA